MVDKQEKLSSFYHELIDRIYIVQENIESHLENHLIFRMKKGLDEETIKFNDYILGLLYQTQSTLSEAYSEAANKMFTEIDKEEGNGK